MLSAVGDPLGKGLQTGLKPVGAVVGGVTSPVAEGASKVTTPAANALGVGKGQESLAEGDGKIGGNPQTGANPLGL